MCSAMNAAKHAGTPKSEPGTTNQASDQGRRDRAADTEGADGDFETVAIIERHRRRESSVEEALIEMYLLGLGMPGRGNH